MLNRIPLVTCELYLDDETPQSYLFSVSGFRSRAQWVPKYACTDVKLLEGPGRKCRLTMAERMAVSKRLTE